MFIFLENVVSLLSLYVGQPTSFLINQIEKR